MNRQRGVKVVPVTASKTAARTRTTLLTRQYIPPTDITLAVAEVPPESDPLS